MLEWCMIQAQIERILKGSGLKSALREEGGGTSTIPGILGVERRVEGGGGLEDTWQ